jgi:hypothetical protein
LRQDEPQGKGLQTAGVSVYAELWTESCCRM